MKAVVKLKDSNNRGSLNLAQKMCVDFKLKFEGPVWSDPANCEFEIYRSYLDEDTQEAIREAAKDGAWIKFKAA